MGSSSFRTLQHHHDEQHAVDEELEAFELAQHARLGWSAEQLDADDGTEGDTRVGVPMLPTITITRMMIDCTSLNDAGKIVPILTANRAAAQCCQHSTGHKGGEFGSDHVDAHRLRDVLVLAHRHPGAADA